MTEKSSRPLLARCHPSSLHSRWVRTPAAHAVLQYANSLLIAASARNCRWGGRFYGEGCTN